MGQQDPAWFSTCKIDGGCVRVHVASAIPAVTLHNSTINMTTTAGYKWCIDSQNGVVYAKIVDQPSRSVALFQALAVDSECRFLIHHWTDGDLVRVYQQSGLNCTLDWVQLPQPSGITDATLHIDSTLR